MRKFFHRAAKHPRGIQQRTVRQFVNESMGEFAANACATASGAR